MSSIAGPAHFFLHLVCTLVPTEARPALATSRPRVYSWPEEPGAGRNPLSVLHHQLNSSACRLQSNKQLKLVESLI